MERQPVAVRPARGPGRPPPRCCSTGRRRPRRRTRRRAGRPRCGCRCSRPHPSAGFAPVHGMFLPAGTARTIFRGRPSAGQADSTIMVGIGLPGPSPLTGAGAPSRGRPCGGSDSRGRGRPRGGARPRPRPRRRRPCARTGTGTRRGTRRAHEQPDLLEHLAAHGFLVGLAGFDPAAGQGPELDPVVPTRGPPVELPHHQDVLIPDDGGGHTAAFVAVGFVHACIVAGDAPRTSRPGIRPGVPPNCRVRPAREPPSRRCRRRTAGGWRARCRRGPAQGTGRGRHGGDQQARTIQTPAPPDAPCGTGCRHPLLRDRPTDRAADEQDRADRPGADAQAGRPQRSRPPGSRNQIVAEQGPVGHVDLQPLQHRTGRLRTGRGRPRRATSGRRPLPTGWLHGSRGRSPARARSAAATSRGWRRPRP